MLNGHLLRGFGTAMDGDRDFARCGCGCIVARARCARPYLHHDDGRRSRLSNGTRLGSPSEKVMPCCGFDKCGTTIQSYAVKE